MQEKNQKEISWKADEHIHHEKSAVWYLIAGIISATTIIWSLWSRDYLMLATLLLIFGAAFFSSHKKPKKVKVVLTEKGLIINDQIYRYDTSLKNFWIVYQPPEIKTLNFDTTQLLNQTLTVQLEDENPIEIRKFLLDYLPEELDKDEPPIDRLLRTLKF